MERCLSFQFFSGAQQTANDRYTYDIQYDTANEQVFKGVIVMLDVSGIHTIVWCRHYIGSRRHIVRIRQ